MKTLKKLLSNYKFDIKKFKLGMRTFKTGLSVFLVLLV
ncbi:TPA: aromatic acid exporter family protein, partial [Streptococcus agalactiae]